MNIIIYGMGTTGQALCKLLAQGNNLYCYDDNISQYNHIDSIDFANIDYCICSPGIANNTRFFQLLSDNGTKIIGELEYCASRCPATMVSVTGTNGKTTITQMIQHILIRHDISSYLLGNGGVPFSSKLNSITKQDIVVLESSSFQLERCVEFAPYISLFANIGEDHIDYHQSMEKYILAKINNFCHQHSGQYAIFNADDICSQLADGCRCTTMFYSRQIPCNCYIENNNVVLNNQSLCKCDMGILANYTPFNQSNALAAILACSLMGVPLRSAVQYLDSFVFDAHRNQYVATVDGVDFFDDSKATNVAAVMAAIGCHDKKIALIAGGYDKGYQFDNLFDNLGSVVHMSLIGDTAVQLSALCKRYNVSFALCDNMQQAVQRSFDAIKDVGGVVLLSPACSSFDMYDSYSHRGQHFVECVEKLKYAKS